MDEMKSLKDQIRSVQAACRTARGQEDGRHWEVLSALITVVNSLMDVHQRQEERLYALETAMREQQAQG